MRRLSLILLFVAATFAVGAQKRALLLIDIQDFYFSGPNALVNPDSAAQKAAVLLSRFREKGELVIHVKHNAKEGANIYYRVTPLSGEKVVTKEKVNSFSDTDLNVYLKDNGVTDLVICGMMTHMCVEGAFRAATDLGYRCTLVEDACATRSLLFGGVTVPSKMVHSSTLATLTFYGKVQSLKEFLAQ